jgi:hypothetical protein
VTTQRTTARAVLAFLALTVGALALAPNVSAQPDGTASDTPPAVVEAAAPTADGADPTAVTACSQFAEVLDTTALYYGDFADSLDGFAAEQYSDPAVNSSNVLGRTALRQGAAAAMAAANLPGLAPPIADPMRTWSLDATKLLIKMGLHGTRDSLNVTADELNNDALAAQQACADAGTHA